MGPPRMGGGYPSQTEEDVSHLTDDAPDPGDLATADIAALDLPTPTMGRRSPNSLSL
jgi:hypothetical protein